VDSGGFYAFTIMGRSARIYIMNDAENLYIALTIEDETLSENDKCTISLITIMI